MRDNNHVQTPQKDRSSSANRRSKPVPDHSLLKNAKKNLNSEFATVVQGAALSELPKESADFSLISEIVDDFQFSESTESFVFPLHPEASTPSESSFLHDLTSVSSGISSDMYTTSTASSYPCQGAEEKASTDAEIAIKHLRQAQFQLMNSVDIDLQSKRLVDAMLEVVVRESRGSTGEKSCSHSLILKKMLLLVSLIFLVVILTLLFSALHTPRATQAFLGALPT